MKYIVLQIQNQVTVAENRREAVSRWRIVTVEALKMISVVPLVRSLPQIFLGEPECTAVGAKKSNNIAKTAANSPRYDGHFEPPLTLWGLWVWTFLQSN